MKTTRQFGFEGGVMAVRESGHGERDGSGYFQLDESDINWEPHDEADGQYTIIEIPASELIELRDFLNRQFPLTE